MSLAGSKPTSLAGGRFGPAFDGVENLPPEPTGIEIETKTQLISGVFRSTIPQPLPADFGLRSYDYLAWVYDTEMGCFFGARVDDPAEYQHTNRIQFLNSSCRTTLPMKMAKEFGLDRNGDKVAWSKADGFLRGRPVR